MNPNQLRLERDRFIAELTKLGSTNEQKLECMTKQFDKITAFQQLAVSLEDQMGKAEFKSEIEFIL